MIIAGSCSEKKDINKDCVENTATGDSNINDVNQVPCEWTSEIIQQSTGITYEEKSCNFIDSDIFENEIRWAIKYVRNNNLMTLESAIDAYSSKWVPRDSIVLWWNEE